MSKIRNRFYLIFSLLSLVFLTGPLFAQEAAKEPIVVKGDRVEYLYEEKKVTGINNVVITYKDVTITCDQIEVDMEKRIGKASGNVTLTQGKSIFRGEKVDYDFDAGKGTIIEAEAESEPWYGKSKEAHKVGDKSYFIQRGHMSTCELDPPHYHIQAREMRIFLDDRVEAKHVWMFVGRYPVFYIPYYYHPLDDKRPRVTIIPGRNGAWGYYVLSAWRYYFHEWSRGYIHLDWREKRGFAGGVDYKYKLGYFGKGLARFYYLTEYKDPYEDEDGDVRKATTGEAAEGFEPGDERWRIHLRHKWRIDEDTLAIGEYEKLKDGLFLKDYFYKEEYERKREPETYLSVIRTRPGYVLSAYARRRINKFFTVVEKLPELKLDIMNQRLDPNASFYYSSVSTFSNLAKRFRNDEEENLKANRFDTYQKFSRPFKVLGALNLNPYIANRATWFSEDALDHMNEYRLMPAIGIESSIRFHRIFPYETDFLNLDIHGLRHLIQPSVHYICTPTPNLKSVDLKQFDNIDNLGRDHRIALALENKLQTKQGSESKVFDLVRFKISTDYLLHMKDPDPDDLGQDDDENVTRLSDFNFDLEVRPYSWLLLKTVSRWDYTMSKFEAFNTDLVVDYEDKWSFGFSHRFEDNPTLGVSSQFITDTSFQISPKWEFSMYHRLKRNPGKSDYKLEEQSYCIIRDLHCWLAEFTYDIARHVVIDDKTGQPETEVDHRIWLVMRLKAFPQLHTKLFRATHTRPRGGSRSAEYHD